MNRGRSISEALGGAVESAPVDVATHGLRLDAAAARLFTVHSRARLRSWIESGHVTVNGVPVLKPRTVVANGDLIGLQAPPPRALPELAAQPMDLDIIHEDDAVVVLNKPPGLTVHPGAGRPDGTLQNALMHRWPDSAVLPRNGLVHRLDKDTSGLLVVARTEWAYQALVRDLAARRIRREYDAIVSGVLPAGGTVEAAIGRHSRDRKRMAVTAGGKSAITHYRVVERFAAHTQLRVRLETGRTHQIRVHLSHLRHPIVGDGAYGGRVLRGRGLPVALREVLARFPRQALHARSLALQHPVTGETLRCTAPLPSDFRKLLAALRRHART